MAHFAELDENNVVKRVIVVNNNDCCDEKGVEKEEIGIAFCKKLLGGRWIQTSYNAHRGRRVDPNTNDTTNRKGFRGNFAGIGYIYDEELDAFIPPKPYPSWILDKETFSWKPPKPLPDDDKLYVWSEKKNEWVLDNGAS